MRLFTISLFTSILGRALFIIGNSDYLKTNESIQKYEGNRNKIGLQCRDLPELQKTLDFYLYNRNLTINQFTSPRREHVTRLLLNSVYQPRRRYLLGFDCWCFESPLPPQLLPARNYFYFPTRRLLPLITFSPS
jgi:hypothetical protein